jgi:hypothetical protein
MPRPWCGVHAGGRPGRCHRAQAGASLCSEAADARTVRMSSPRCSGGAFSAGSQRVLRSWTNAQGPHRSCFQRINATPRPESGGCWAEVLSGPDQPRGTAADRRAGGQGAPPWKLHQEINRSRFAIRRVVVALYRPAQWEPRRSALRLSLAEREEIWELAADEPLRAIARGLAAARPAVCPEVAANAGPGRYRARG